MTKLLTIIKKIIKTCWNIFSYFFGCPYEKQAENLDLDKADPTLRGPQNPTSTRTVYRANKVSN